MPVITPVRVSTPLDVDQEIWKWTGMAQGDTGAPVLCNYKQDKSVMWKASTPGTGTLAIEESHDPAASGYFTAHDTRGPSSGDLTALALATTFSGRQVLESAYLIRPNVNGGAGASGVDVWLFMRGR